MFDSIRNNKRIVQVFLVMITLPFAFWGVESYVRNAGGGDEVATVGGAKVTLQEFQRALREQEERMRASLGPNFNPAMFEDPEVRRAVLDSLASQRVLALHGRKTGLAVSDAQLGQIIQTIPQFQEAGKFSRELYDAFVASQGQSQAEFEARLRQDLSMRQLLGPIREASIVARSGADRWVAVLQESREVAEARFKPEQFSAQVTIADSAVKAVYEAQGKRFETPERVRVEYLLLSQDDLAKDVAVSDEEVRTWYQARSERFRQSEERRASHILIKAAKEAPEAEVKAAQAKAEDILAQAKRAPGDFAGLAKKHSDDSGSAQKGGDLDWFPRGVMVKPFEEAVFSLKEGELSGIVRSDFGFHIIRLTGIKAEKVKPLEEVRAQVVGDLKRQAAAKKYAESAEAFANSVYEQADSLKPAAEKFKLPVQTSGWISRGAAVPPFDHPKLLAAIFSDDAIKNQRNTEAVEVAPKVLASARVLERQAAEMRPLQSVRKEIEEQLRREEATRLAIAAGEAALARLAKGETVDLAWGPARAVTRLGAPGIAPEALRAVFRSEVAKLPAYAGAAGQDGSYAIYRIAKVQPFVAGTVEDPRGQMLRQQYARVLAEEDLAAWLAALRLRYPVEINKKALEAKER